MEYTDLILNGDSEKYLKNVTEYESLDQYIEAMPLVPTEKGQYKALHEPICQEYHSIVKTMLQAYWLRHPIKRLSCSGRGALSGCVAYSEAEIFTAT